MPGPEQAWMRRCRSRKPVRWSLLPSPKFRKCQCLCSGAKTRWTAENKQMEPTWWHKLFLLLFVCIGSLLNSFAHAATYCIGLGTCATLPRHRTMLLMWKLTSWGERGGGSSRTRETIVSDVKIASGKCSTFCPAYICGAETSLVHSTQGSAESDSLQK